MLLSFYNSSAFLIHNIPHMCPASCGESLPPAECLNSTCYLEILQAKRDKSVGGHQEGRLYYHSTQQDSNVTVFPLSQLTERKPLTLEHRKRNNFEILFEGEKHDMALEQMHPVKPWILKSCPVKTSISKHRWKASRQVQLIINLSKTVLF